MATPIQFTNLTNEVSEQLETFTTEKLSRLNKLASNITSIHVTFNIIKQQHIAEADIHIPHTNIHAKAESDDMYKTVDFLVDKLTTQLKKHKEKNSDHG